MGDPTSGVGAAEAVAAKEACMAKDAVPLFFGETATSAVVTKGCPWTTGESMRTGNRGGLIGGARIVSGEATSVVWTILLLPLTVMLEIRVEGDVA